MASHDFSKPTKEEIKTLTKFVIASEVTGYISNDLLRTIHSLILYYLVNEDEISVLPKEE